MAFNITKFKSGFERLGGPAHANLFEIDFAGGAPSNKFFGNNEFRLFCKSVIFPGIAVNVDNVDYTGQLPKSFPKNVTNPGPITAVFFVDSDHQVLNFFHSWVRKVVNYSKRDGNFAEFGQKLPMEVGFKDDFSCQLSIKHFSSNSFPNAYYEATCLKAYPINVGALQLAWDSNDNYLTVEVQFALDDFYMSADNTGNTGERSKRGGGLLDILGDVAGFADVVRGTIKSGRPTSIQDAVNRLNRLGNSFGNLSDNI